MVFCRDWGGGDKFVKCNGIIVRDSADFKNKLMGVMVYFKPAKININQYCSQAYVRGQL
jgi:hypothetical protein